ncbi:uncharacterized protein ASCRUDRAFT_81669 [Ascoidea rubescens DSM 1968]|uniref:Uncharacterized protein n=1 Tax=Ascoidea rubescens DSM 1968 TaxID=1344418 RepID=A0A1D2VDT3_9ASCO|nr:hypothetical protein ASCRUDRAFT_81669 [Ascoidea rubescens DSM 1968]ODV59759.1 hypothetical protein ASCRUDRAFT_81669 [Ascoidea rubescens DSM 1968]
MKKNGKDNDFTKDLWNDCNALHNVIFHQASYTMISDWFLNSKKNEFVDIAKNYFNSENENLRVKSTKQKKRKNQPKKTLSKRKHQKITKEGRN